MRALLINYEYPPIGGGAGNATAHLAREFAGKGLEVTVLTAAWSTLPRIERTDGVTIRRVPVLRRHMDRCTPFEMATFLGSGLIAAGAVHRNTRPDVSIAFFGIPSGPIGLAMKILYGVPYIVSLRGGDVPGFQPYDLASYHRALGGTIRCLWRRAGAVVANSEGLRELAENAAADVPVLVIPNGVDSSRFSPARRHSPEGPVRIGVAGRIVFQKGVDVLLNALSRMPSCAQVFLEVIGDGPARPALERLARGLGLDDRVRFVGWKTPPEMPGLYRQLDAFVLPSRDEGMPNVVLEAMATGLPVVATRIAGNEELVIQGETGFLVPPEDSDTLATTLTTLVPDPSLREHMGAAGRALVEERYTWARVAERYLDVMKRVALQRDPGPKC
jgi:glycosyltransferase involved in cell wall biosynthesis